MVTRPILRGETYGVPLIGCDDRYEDRALAGRQLAERLQRYRGGRAIVLGIPPGGIAVAGEIARALRLPLDVLVAREIFVPAYPELIVGALSEGSGLCINAAALRLPGVSLQAIWREARNVRKEIAALVEIYRQDRPLPLLNRRPVILVDDGLGSGLLQLAALQALHHFHPQSCIVATPWGTTAAVQQVARHADVLVALASGGDEQPGGHWSRSLGDDDGVTLLERCRLRGGTELL